MKRVILLTILLSLLSSCGPDDFLALVVGESEARVPNISIVTPAAENESADTTFTIQTTFESIQVLDTWNLYYVSEATDARSAQIASNLPVTNRTIAWDTTEMPAGQYFFYGELNASDAVITTTSAGSIYIDHPGTDNTSPTVTVTSPNGSEEYTPGDSVSVAWTSTDSEGDDLTVEIYYSDDDGNSWTSITSDETGSSYDWEVPSDQSTGLGYRIRVKVADDTGATSSDISNEPFTIL
jgi:hypothetical protein